MRHELNAWEIEEAYEARVIAEEERVYLQMPGEDWRDAMLDASQDQLNEFAKTLREVEAMVITPEAHAPHQRRIDLEEFYKKAKLFIDSAKDIGCDWSRNLAEQRVFDSQDETDT